MHNKKTERISFYLFPGLRNISLPNNRSDNFLTYLTIADIVTQVCHVTGVGADEILIKTHKPRIADVRYIIYYLGLKYIHTTKVNTISELVGLKQDHSTVIHGRKKVEDMISVYADYKAFIGTIEKSLIALNESRAAEVKQPISEHKS